MIPRGRIAGLDIVSWPGGDDAQYLPVLPAINNTIITPKTVQKRGWAQLPRY